MSPCSFLRDADLIGLICSAYSFCSKVMVKVSGHCSYMGPRYSQGNRSCKRPMVSSWHSPWPPVMVAST